MIMAGAITAAMVLPFSAMAFGEPSNTEDVRKTKINELGNAFGTEYLKWIEEDNPKAKSMIKKQMDILVLQLEKYGITYTEKYKKIQDIGQRFPAGILVKIPRILGITTCSFA